MYEKQKILVDPHTAVGIGVEKKFKLKGKTIVLATAPPSKFSKVVADSTGINPELPDNLKDILSKDERYDSFPKDVGKIKDYILKNI